MVTELGNKALGCSWATSYTTCLSSIRQNSKQDKYSDCSGFGVCMFVPPENQKETGYQQSQEGAAREERELISFSSVVRRPECRSLILLAASTCLLCVCQLLTGNAPWCRGNPLSESGVSQLDRPQLDSTGHWLWD